MSGNKEVTAFPLGDNLFEWVGTVVGSRGSVYEGHFVTPKVLAIALD
jgi:ubiquitin-protein ligase